MLIKDNFGNLGISVYNMPVSCTSRVIEVFALGGGAESAHSAGFSLFLGVKKFRSLAVEKEVKGVNLSLAPLRLSLTSVASFPVEGRSGWVLTKNIKLTNLSSPRPLRERKQSCLSSQAKATNAGEGSKQGFILLVTFPHPLREGVNVLGWLVASPHPLRERVEFLSELCELRNSGVGLNQELTPTAPLSEGKLFSDTLRLNLASVVFPRHPIPECVMLNLFQHLTGLACDLPSCKILNSSKIEWETNTHNNIIKTDFLRFQDDNACTSPRPLSIQLRKDHSRPMCHVILSPITIQGRRIHKTLKERNSSDSRPQNDGTLASLATPRPLRERVEFQVERERNLEIRVRGFKTFTPHNPRRCA